MIPAVKDLPRERARTASGLVHILTGLTSSSFFARTFFNYSNSFLWLFFFFIINHTSNNLQQIVCGGAQVGFLHFSLSWLEKPLSFSKLVHRRRLRCWRFYFILVFFCTSSQVSLVPDQIGASSGKCFVILVCVNFHPLTSYTSKSSFKGTKPLNATVTVIFVWLSIAAALIIAAVFATVEKSLSWQCIQSPCVRLFDIRIRPIENCL